MIALHGQDRRLESRQLDGEHFAVMAGVGFDAELVGGAERRAKDRLAGCLRPSGLAASAGPVGPGRVKVEGRPGTRPASCVDARQSRPDRRRGAGIDDATGPMGCSEVGVHHRGGALQWCPAR